MGAPSQPAARRWLDPTHLGERFWREFTEILTLSRLA